jgi:hypothetical protein
MLSSRHNGVLVASCSYCCGDLLIADGEQEACRYCGNPASLFSQVSAHAVPDWTSLLAQRQEPTRAKKPRVANRAVLIGTLDGAAASGSRCQLEGLMANPAHLARDFPCEEKSG